MLILWYKGLSPCEASIVPLNYIPSPFYFMVSFHERVSVNGSGWPQVCNKVTICFSSVSPAGCVPSRPCLWFACLILFSPKFGDVTSECVSHPLCCRRTVSLRLHGELGDSWQLQSAPRCQRSFSHTVFPMGDYSEGDISTSSMHDVQDSGSKGNRLEHVFTAHTLLWSWLYTHAPTFQKHPSGVTRTLECEGMGWDASAPHSCPMIQAAWSF